MPSPTANNIRLLSLIVYLTLAKARAHNPTTVSGARPDGSTSKNLIIAAAVIAPGLAFSVIFMMAALCRRPFGNKLVLRTPALLLGISPPYEDASSLGLKLHTRPPPYTIGEANV